MKGRTLFCLFMGGIALSYLCLGVWAVEMVMIAKGDLSETGGGWVRVVWWAAFVGVLIGGWTALIATIREERGRPTDTSPSPPH